MIFHSPPIRPWETHLREPGEENKPRYERRPCLRTQLFTVMSVHAAAYAQPGGGTVHRLLLGSFLWHESTRLKRHPRAPASRCATSTTLRFTLPPMMREQLFWWHFGFLWGFDFFGKETESRRVTCSVRAAVFGLQFLAGCLKNRIF